MEVGATRSARLKPLIPKPYIPRPELPLLLAMQDAERLILDEQPCVQQAGGTIGPV